MNNKNNLLCTSRKITFNSWYEIYLQMCKKQKSQNLPNLAFNYCFEKAKDLYIKMKKLSKQKNTKFMYIARIIYKEFILIEESNKKLNFLKIDNTPKEEKISLRNYLKQRTNNTLSHTNTFNSTNSLNKFKHKILNESEEEKKEEKEKQKSNYINKLNKLNIYVGDYDYLINNNIVEKTKIYDGNLCTTYLLKKEFDKQSSEIIQGSQKKEKVKGLLSDRRAIFIANDSSLPTTRENSFRAPFIKYSRRSRLIQGENFRKSNSKFCLRKEILGEDKILNKLPSKICSNTNSKYSTLIIPKINERNYNDDINKKSNISFMTLNNKNKESINHRRYSDIKEKSQEKLNKLDRDHIFNEKKRGSSEIKNTHPDNLKGYLNFNKKFDAYSYRTSLINRFNQNFNPNTVDKTILQHKNLLIN